MPASPQALADALAGLARRAPVRERRSVGGSLAALLGASPGASVAVAVMTGLLEASFAETVPHFAERMRALIPTYGVALEGDASAVAAARARAAEVLGIVQ